MKIDKEYPATHSMSTAWYVADEDGNVAIMDYNDNGPVPWETEQTCIEDLIYGHCENYHTNDFIAIDLTDDQIDDLMENPHQPEDEEFWCDCIFQIDLEQETDFLELAKNPDIRIDLCISKRRGLYSVCCFDCTEERGKKYVVIESSTLKKMIDRGMIKQIFKAKDFYINDEWKDEKLHFERQFSSAPYYIYGQPYWNELLAERLNIPINPVKLSQFPPALRSRVPRVPLKFKECKQFQIAEWIPCCFNSEEEISINGYVFQPIVLTNGTKAYVYTSQGGIKFIDYCSERKKYNCKECSHACCTVHGSEFSNKPTVLFVFHPFSDYDYSMSVRSDVIIRHSVRVPLLHKIPFKHPKGYWMSKDDAMKQVTDDMLTNFFMKNYKHFEDTVLRFNPQVIILEQKTKEILSQQYLIDDRHIRINNQQYLCYLSNEIEEKRVEITKLALLPYRGIEMPYIISVEEMEQYKKKYNVSD
jgi:hypothetical protein